MPKSIGDAGTIIIKPQHEQAGALAGAKGVQQNKTANQDSLVINTNASPDPKADRLAPGTKPAMVLPRDTLTEPADMEMLKEVESALNKAQKLLLVDFYSVMQALTELLKVARQESLERGIVLRDRRYDIAGLNKADGTTAINERTKGGIITGGLGIGLGLVQAAASAGAAIKSVSPIKESAKLASDQGALAEGFKEVQNNLANAQKEFDNRLNAVTNAMNDPNTNPERLTKMQDQLAEARGLLDKSKDLFNNAYTKFEVASKPLTSAIGVQEAKVQMARAVNETVSALSGGGRGSGEVYQASQNQRADLLQVEIDYRRQLDATAESDKQFAEQAASATMATMNDSLQTGKQIMSSTLEASGTIARNMGT